MKKIIIYETQNHVKFNGKEILKEYVEASFDFAWEMSFGQKGEHRKNRSGGDINRKDGEIFANTFQGKLGEYAVYQTYNGIYEINEPDLTTERLGSWDSTDFILEGNSVNVKSTKYYGNLLLLETKDWDCDGLYIPNIGKKGKISKYDHFVLTRISPSVEDLMKNKRWLYCNASSGIVKEKDLRKLILEEVKMSKKIESCIWKYDIPGYITHEMLVKIIKDNQVIPKNAVLNYDPCKDKQTEMDAENYYCETGNMLSIYNEE